MGKTKHWIKAARLRTLPLSISGIVVGSFFAFQTHWSWLIFSLAILTTLLFQVLSNFANDLGDSMKGADNSNRIGPTRAVQSGIISFKEMRNAVLLVSLLSFVSAGLLIYFGTRNMTTGIVNFYIVLAIFCVFAAITYTIGKKAYGYNGLGDLMVFIFFGCVSVLGVYPLFANELNYELIPAAVTIGFLSVAVLNLNNMRDQENDRTVGKNTLVVRLGDKNARFYHQLLISIAFIAWCAFISLSKNYLNWISLLPFVILIKHLLFVRKVTEFKAFDSQLKIVALSTFAISLIYAITSICA